MPIYLRQSTASQEISLGPFLDSTDGNTAETGLTIANTDILLWKTGATTLASKNSGGATHISNGIYYAVLDATDTATVGSMTIHCHPSGALATKLECVVLTALVYDSLIAGTDNLQVDLIQWIGTAPLALSSQRVQTTVGAMGSGVVTATAIATGAITSAKFAAGAIDAAAIAADAIGASELAADAASEIGTAVWATGTRQLTGTQTFNVTGNITGNLSGSVGSVTGAVGSVTGAVGSVTGNVGGIAGTITTLDALDTAQDTQHGTTQSAIAGLNDLSAADVNAEVDTALGDYDAPTNAEMTTAFTEIKGATWDSGTDTLEHIRDKQTDIEADTNELQTDDVPGLIAALNDISAADVNAQCDTALSDYDGPTNAEMAAAFTEIKGATWASGTDTLEAIRDRGDAAWTTGAGGTPPDLLVSTTIATLASQTSFTLTAGSADDDAYNDQVIIVTDQATATQKAVGSISDYTGSTLTVTLSADPGIFTMAVGDTVEIVAATGAAGSGASAAEVWTYGTRVLTANTNLNDPTVAAIRAEIDTNSTQLAAIVADTNELQADDYPTTLATLATAAALATAQADLDTLTGTDGATLATSQPNYAPNTATPLDAAGVRSAVGLTSANLDTQLADLPTVAEFTARTLAAASYFDPTVDVVANVTLVDTTTTNTDMVAAAPTAAAIRTEIDANSTQLAAIVADTGELQTDWVNGGRLDLLVDAILADTNELQADDYPTTLATLATSAALATVDSNVDAILVDTGTTLPATLAALATQATAAAIEADTQNIQSRIPAALVSGRMSSDAVAISGSTAAADNLEASAEVIVTGAAETGTLSTTQMTTDLTEATDDHYNGRIVIWTSGVLTGQASDITDYAGATGLLTFTAVTEAPSNADTFVIV